MRKGRDHTKGKKEKKNTDQGNRGKVTVRSALGEFQRSLCHNTPRTTPLCLSGNLRWKGFNSRGPKYRRGPVFNCLVLLLSSPFSLCAQRSLCSSKTGNGFNWNPEKSWSAGRPMYRSPKGKLAGCWGELSRVLKGLLVGFKQSAARSIPIGENVKASVRLWDKRFQGPPAFSYVLDKIKPSPPHACMHTHTHTHTHVHTHIHVHTDTDQHTIT